MDDRRHIVLVRSFSLPPSSLARRRFSATSARQAELKLISSPSGVKGVGLSTHNQLPHLASSAVSMGRMCQCQSPLPSPWHPDFTPESTLTLRAATLAAAHTHSGPMHRLSAHLQLMMTFQTFSALPLHPAQCWRTAGCRYDTSASSQAASLYLRRHLRDLSV